MDTHSVCLALVLIVVLNGSVGQQYESPCPDVYEVVFDDVEWYGIIQIPSEFRSTCKRLTIRFSTTKEIKSSVRGWIELTGNREKVWQNVWERKDIKYKIYFPSQETVPDVESIDIDGFEICRNSLVLANGRRENFLNLDHLFYIGDDIGNNYCYKNNTEWDGFYINRNGTIINYEKGQLRKNNQGQSYQNDNNRFHEYCGVTYSRNNIKNVLHTDKDWPWLAAIYLKTVRGLDFLCTGTLISNRHILTAAHCLKQKGNNALTTSQVLIKMGQSNLLDWANPSAKMLSAENYYYHPKYDGNLGFTHDLVIIEIKPIAFSENILPICLTDSEQNEYLLNNQANRVLMTVGWKFDTKMQLDNPASQQSVARLIQTNQCIYNNQYFAKFINNLCLCEETIENNKVQSYGSGLYTLGNNNKWLMVGVLSMNLKNSSRYNVYHDAIQLGDWISDVVYDEIQN